MIQLRFKARVGAARLPIPSSLWSALRRTLACLCALAAIVLCAAPSAAETWPNKTIRIVIPFPVGGSVDGLARVFAARLQTQLGVPVIVESRPGAGGNVAGNAVSKSPPDGYTWLMHTNGLAIAPSMYRSLPFDPVADLARVAELVTTSSIFIVNNKMPTATFRDFIAYAKANPGKLNYGATGVGTATQLTMEMVKHATGMDIQIVPFTGDAPLMSALIGGEVQCALVPSTAAKSHLDAGAVRGLAVTTEKRVPTMPDIPTMMEAGIPGFSVTGWIGLFAPSGTPREIVDRMARESLIAIASDDLAQPLVNLTVDAADVGPDAFDKIYKDEVASFRQVVKDANIPTQD